MARALLLSLVLPLVLLGACGQSTTPASKAPAAPAAAVDPQDLNIEIGRYGVMLDHVRNLTAHMGDAAAAETATEDTRPLARLLRETVWDYNLERSRLCARGLYTRQSCGPTFEPVWLSDAPEAQPSLDEIKQRADAVGAEVQPFWNAVCADVRAHTANEQEKMYVCAIE